MLNSELRRYLLYIVIIISGCSMAYVLVLGQVGENLQSQLHSRPQHSSFMETTSADQYKRNLQIWQSIEAERKIENEIQIENENEIEKEELSSTIAGKDNADSSFFDYKENEKDDIEEEHEELHKQENITEYLRSRENIYEERLQILHSNCPGYTERYVKVEPWIHNKRIRFDRKHFFMYCENYKIGSSTWVDHLLNLANVKKAEERFHKQVEMLYPAMKGKTKVEFEKTAFKFFIVRDPFERLLSAYKDKMTGPVRCWKTFGKIQLEIMRKHNRTESKMVTFPEFAEYVAEKLEFLTNPKPFKSYRFSEKIKQVNYHWIPVYINCNPCKQAYDAIFKLETLNEDTYYIKNKLDINLDVHLQSRVATDGHTSTDRTVKAFSAVDKRTKEKLLQIYEPDFKLFGYTYEQYFG